MVWLHPDSPLKCVECGNKQLSVTFSKNPASATFEQWYVLCSRKSEHEDGKIWFGVWRKDQPPQNYPVQPSDYTPRLPSEALAVKDTTSRLRCMSPYCSKISSIVCPRQFCASDCRRAPGGPCNSHIAKPTKPKLMVAISRSSLSRPNQPLLSSDDEDLALAIKASLLPSSVQQSLSAHPPVASSSQPQSAYTVASSSSVPPSFASSAPKQLTIPPAIKPRISSQMAPAWQTRVEASSKAVVEKEERAARQALLQQALKENLNILFFDRDDEPGRQLALQGSKDMPDFPWVKPDDFIHRFGPDIVAIDYRSPIGRWVELGRLDIVYKVSNNETLIFRRRGVHCMPGIDDQVDQIHQPPPPAHFFKGISGQRTAVRTEKKARKQSRLVIGSRHGSPFNPLVSGPHPSVSYPTSPACSDDGGSSDVEVSEITDCRDLMRHASSQSHTGVVPYKHTHSSDGGSSDIEVVVGTNSGFTRQVHNSDTSHAHALLPSSSSSPSPIIVDSPASSPPSSADSDPQTSSFAESSCLTSPEQSNYHTDSSPPSSLSALPPQSSSGYPPKSRLKKDLTWHYGLYCVDVVDGFEKMGNISLKGLSKSERFDIAFPGRRYADSTVRDAQTQWARANNSAKEAAIAAGRTTSGLWRVFSAQHPIKHRKSMGHPN